MAVSPADFYAYSRATGAPIPENPEERAQMAPEVLAFRRNQLRAAQPEQQQGADPLSVGLGIGLGLAGLGGAALGMRRFMRGPKQSATAGVRQANLAEMAEEMAPVRRAAQEYQPEPSKIPTQAIEEEFVAYRPDPKEMVSRRVAEARRQSATEDLLRAARASQDPYQPDIPGIQATLMALRGPVIDESAGFVSPIAPARPISIAPDQPSLFNPRSYIEQSGAVAPIEDLTSLQQQVAPQVIDQKINAIESGEDQMTGRVRQQLQRNEDLNLANVDALEDVTGNINIAAAQTTDGAPVDQIATARPLSSQELADLAREEMISLRQNLEARGLRPGTQRFENALAQSWVNKSISGATPGTTKFTELQQQGKIDVSLPTIIRKAVEAESVGADPTGFVPERTVINIGPEAQIESTAAGTAIRGASPSLQEVPLREELRQLYGTAEALVPGVPLQVGQDIPGALRSRGAMEAGIPETAQSKQEIVYSFLNRPRGPEVPGGAAGIGVYGLEPGYVPGAMSKATGQYSAASERQPTYVPPWMLKKEQTPFSGVSSQGLERALEKSTKSGATAITAELDRRQRAKNSIVVSEAMRRARIEGRDPQIILKQMGIGI